MSSEQIEDPTQFLAHLGGLHDARIDRLNFHTDSEVLSLAINDLNANFTETPEYQGCRPCTLILRSIETFFLDVEASEGIRISNAAIVKEASRLRLEVDLNLGGGDVTRGHRSVVVTFKSLHLCE